MPRIRGASIEEHHAMVWVDLAEAMRQLLLERDYDSINMGHIATRAGLARNTLYNYARDQAALVLALTHRVGQPTVDRVATIAARSTDPAAERMREIIETVLVAFQDPVLQLMFRPGFGLPFGELPKGPDSPFHAIVVEVENVVRDGVERGEFRDVGDVHLAVELLSGVMRAGAERIGRDPATCSSTVHAARELILASLDDRSD
ncbi:MULTISPECIES: TetR/AcrR family transcriptional regulator [unclassified Micromonospora]|uniref:TetR/AcrR family transcriptional regulator n=1 Tax=unclassified Micromonospora TaxID=2617518 RepID=UPI0010347E58|nr:MULTISPECIES: TetR/AcrR family transcriptional regulator [unclassified Micromonospora]QKW15092.1 TetR/AcrR family transcriptional regulator [Verrucosispora sp. NA02020]TBL45026.1 TetR/AcrR family transcriptional regulator [Verrucosispora sp. SN26_14.1]